MESMPLDAQSVTINDHFVKSNLQKRIKSSSNEVFGNCISTFIVNKHCLEVLRIKERATRGFYY